MKAVEGLSPGDQLKVTLDSPMALETISRWAGRVGHQVLEVREAGAGVWEITLEKRSSRFDLEKRFWVYYQSSFSNRM